MGQTETKNNHHASVSRKQEDTSPKLAHGMKRKTTLFWQKDLFFSELFFPWGGHPRDFAKILLCDFLPCSDKHFQKGRIIQKKSRVCIREDVYPTLAAMAMPSLPSMDAVMFCLNFLDKDALMKNVTASCSACASIPPKNFDSCNLRDPFC